jgi:Xaa-Pro aminopeptidase
MTARPTYQPPDGVTWSDTLAHGHVVTVEPRVRPAGIGRAGIHDDVVVTTDGFWPDTTTPKDISVPANRKNER